MKRFLCSFLAITLFFFIPYTGQATPSVQEVISKTGVKAWLIEDHTHPIIYLSLSFKGGTALEPIGKEGLAGLVADLLNEGAGPLTSQDFQRHLEDLSIHLSFNVSLDNFSGFLKTLSYNRKKAFELLRLVFTAPRFDTEPTERIRSQTLDSLQRAAKNPNHVLSREFAKILFPNHPYGRNRTTESITSIKRTDFVKFVTRHFARDNLVIGVYGDITAEELEYLLEHSFGSLPEKATIETVASVSPNTDGLTHIIPFPIPQSFIIMAQAGIDRQDPDFYTAIILNHILGEYNNFASRLFREIREKRGLAYTISSTLFSWEKSSLLVAKVNTRNATVKDVLAILRKEWQRLRDEGPTEEEVRDAKAYLTGSFPLLFTSSKEMATVLVNMQIWNLGREYLKKRNHRINAITISEVRNLARRFLNPEALTTVIVGEPENLFKTTN